VFGTTSRQPYVACPTPTALPFDVAGPRKPGCTCLDGTTECADCMYAIWEQEGGEPPEGHRIERRTFAMNEPATVEPLTVRLQEYNWWSPDLPADQTLLVLQVIWHNPTTAPTGTLTETMLVTPTLSPAGPVSITYETALGVWVAGERSTPTDDAVAAVAAVAAYRGIANPVTNPLPDTIPAGDSEHWIPILVPSVGAREDTELTLPYLGEDADPDEGVTIWFDLTRPRSWCLS
jgi:hypothetical protein